MDSLSDQAALVTALLDPARYPHPVDRVERIETHISTILLAGEFAYKIKKPLALPFLDFSTLERREYFCDQELRLNRRFAPELYLERIPIGGTHAAPVLGGAGAPIEHAVRMRRFPQDALLSRQLEVGRLPVADMDSLAQAIAAFHAAAEAAPACSEFAEPAAVTKPVKDTLVELQQLVAGEDAGWVEQLQAWLDEVMPRLEPAFARRRDSAGVRECHGDLHLSNMLLLDQRFQFFDCIEFALELRWIDVMADLAFVLMDLDYRGASLHSRRLRDAYLSHSGDYDGLAVLRFYQAYRAMVRAKISGLRAAQFEAGQPERQLQETETTAYLRLAAGYAAPPKPCLVITCGLAGSGKSTAGLGLVDAAGFIRLRSDVERKRLFGLPAAARTGAATGGGIYSAEVTARTYARLLEITAAALEAGERVVVDATFLRREQREPFRRLAETKSVPFVILQLHADPKELAARVEAREAAAEDASEAGLAVLAQQQTVVEWPTADEGRTVQVDTAAADWRQQLLQVLQVLS